MQNITLDYSNIENLLSKEEIISIHQEIHDAHTKMTNQTGVDNDFLGWVNLPGGYDRCWRV